MEWKHGSPSGPCFVAWGFLSALCGVETTLRSSWESTQAKFLSALCGVETSASGSFSRWYAAFLSALCG
ncbi:MAG: hypothetical protein N3E49_09680, partial [Bacteroidia bacterium]|nr:hypothetical protein [Bacteroidia bacterium]